VQAAEYRLLIEATLVERVQTLSEADTEVVDLGRALGGEQASLLVTCTGNAQVQRLGVDAVLGLVDLAEEEFVSLPALLTAAAGEDIDRVTSRPLHGAHAFRLRLSRSSAATTA
jgi:hypothetical protein